MSRSRKPARRPRWPQWLLAVALFSVALMAGACGPPTLDGRSPEKLAKSAERVRSSLPAAERGRFTVALDRVLAAGRGEVPGVGGIVPAGMSAAEVLAASARIDLLEQRHWIEQRIAQHRDRLAEGEALARLALVELLPGQGDQGKPLLRFKVRNELGEAVDSAWLRIGLELPNGGVLETDEYVGWRPALAPGAVRAMSIPVAGDLARAWPPPPSVRLAARFTLAERAGTILVAEPDAAQRAAIEREIAAAEEELAAFDRRLAR
jgi:hypothetical protein